jgi:predicted enzyme related to lactoylglutathione lyase
MEDAVHGRWVGYVSVKDVPQALAAAAAGGGRILFAAKSIANQGTKAIFIDPDGAELGVMNSSSGDPAEYRADPGDWTWSELFAKDPAKAGQYYQSVAGYEVLADTRTESAGSFVLVSGGYSRASVLPVPNRPKARPIWLLFVRVQSVKDTVARVAELGGRVLLAPSGKETEYLKAIIADPAGAPIGIVQLEADAPAKEQP